MGLAHCQRNPLFGLFPGEDAHFGIRREHRALHGGGVGVRRDIVRQDQDRVLATTHEIACHGEDEVGIGFEHLGHKLVGRLQRNLGPLRVNQRGPQLVQNEPGYLRSRISGRQPTGCAITAAATRLGARFKRLQMKGPPMQKPITMNLSMPR